MVDGDSKDLQPPTNIEVSWNKDFIVLIPLDLIRAPHMVGKVQARATVRVEKSGDVEGVFGRI